MLPAREMFTCLSVFLRVFTCTMSIYSCLLLKRVLIYVADLPVVDLGGAFTPLFAASKLMYFCVHNCMSPLNDYAAVACSNNNQVDMGRFKMNTWFLF